MSLEEQSYRVCRECLHKMDGKKVQSKMFCSLDGREVRGSDKACVNFFDHFRLRDYRHENR